jgi:hypothetical protein
MSTGGMDEVESCLRVGGETGDRAATLRTDKASESVAKPRMVVNDHDFAHGNPSMHDGVCGPRSLPSRTPFAFGKPFRLIARSAGFVLENSLGASESRVVSAFPERALGDSP